MTTTFYAVEQVRKTLDDCGSNWFSQGSMSFFNTRLTQRVYGGSYFVTSERYLSSEPRLYTVRQVVEVEGLPGHYTIETVGEFQGYKTAAQAVKAILTLVNGK